MLVSLVQCSAWHTVGFSAHWFGYIQMHLLGVEAFPTDPEWQSALH